MSLVWTFHEYVILEAGTWLSRLQTTPSGFELWRTCLRYRDQGVAQ
jgi:hypothetical protein